MRNELPLNELKEKLSDLDEITLIEVLGVDSEEIVEAFSDMIEDRYSELLKEVS